MITPQNIAFFIGMGSLKADIYIFFFTWKFWFLDKIRIKHPCMLESKFGQANAQIYKEIYRHPCYAV